MNQAPSAAGSHPPPADFNGTPGGYMHQGHHPMRHASPPPQQHYYHHGGATHQSQYPGAAPSQYPHHMMHTYQGEQQHPVPPEHIYSGSQSMIGGYPGGGSAMGGMSQEQANSLQAFEQQRKELDCEMHKMFSEFRAQRQSIGKVFTAFKTAFDEYEKQVEDMEKKRAALRDRNEEFLKQLNQQQQASLAHHHHQMQSSHETGTQQAQQQYLSYHGGQSQYPGGGFQAAPYVGGAGNPSIFPMNQIPGQKGASEVYPGQYMQGGQQFQAAAAAQYGYPPATPQSPSAFSHFGPSHAHHLYTSAQMENHGGVQQQEGINHQDGTKTQAPAPQVPTGAASKACEKDGKPEKERGGDRKQVQGSQSKTTTSNQSSTPGKDVRQFNQPTGSGQKRNGSVTRNQTKQASAQPQ